MNDPVTQVPCVSYSLEAFMAPSSAVWDEASTRMIPLTATPIEQQPSAYIQATWAGRDYGQVSEVEVNAISNHETLALRLQWACVQPVRMINDINSYADACAVLFPVNNEDDDPASLIQTMGSPGSPVAAWHWRAGAEQPFSIKATGIGKVERSPEHQVQGSSHWDQGKWQVVLARSFDDKDLPLAHGSILRLAFAIWCGAMSERAGLKSHSPVFYPLRLN